MSNFEFTNIRSREDGSYVVNLRNGDKYCDYHVCPPSVDPFAPTGLWDEVVKAVKLNDTIPTDGGTCDILDTHVPSMESVISEEKSKADNVINLIQMELNFAEKSELANLKTILLDWQKYRLTLEKTGLTSDIPKAPEWITS